MDFSMHIVLLVALAFPLSNGAGAFVPHGTNIRSSINNKSQGCRSLIIVEMGLLDGFMREVDNFIDDAMDRKLAGGSTFYGERKSSFSKTKKSYEFFNEKEVMANAKARAQTDDDDSFMKRMMGSGRGGKISGEELRNLVFVQWGQKFPVSIRRKRDALGKQRLYLVVQWKYLGKRNLDLTPEEYIAESDAVAELLTEWEMANSVRNAIQESTARPKTMTQNFPGLFIALDVDQSIIKTW